MERCSLCGTPLRQNDTTCSHCQHPVIKKEQPIEPSAPSSSRTWLISTCLFLILVGGAVFLWYSLQDPVSPEAGQTPSVEALALSEWSDEQTAYNQTYSKERPPTSYDVLRFVRQYTRTIPELATFSKKYDSIETFSAIQFTTLNVFESEFKHLHRITNAVDAPVAPSVLAVTFQKFTSKGATYHLRTQETYQIETAKGATPVTYRVHYRLKVHTDHLQIIDVKRTEVTS
ncbi:hypothetical protein [uncultured Exiguobacterium sp.]|uniref:hypothetical protein n=1 Tax=uncultured Exiguobacterium sp. TaxID=202669 RepID=UPI0025E63F86|nr:hypothetical protein [uncultured Exiguobacterium sp.]